MFVDAFKKFLATLTACSNLSSFDSTFLQRCSEKGYSKLPPESHCSAEDIDFFVAALKQRWHAIKDDVRFDYTYHPATPLTQAWAGLAKVISEEKKESYLSLLMPVLMPVNNVFDPNLLTPLSECKSLGELFLSDDGSLINVRGLVNERQKTFATYIKSQAHPLSLTEMRRLRNKSVQSVNFYINGKTYNSFWDYLKHDLFSSFSKRGDYPRAILIELLELVSDYFNSKPSAAKSIDKKLLQLSKNLKNESVDDVNFLYSQSLLVDGKDEIFIDVLVHCLEKSPQLHSMMLAMARWLCQIDASFVVDAHDALLQSLYKEMEVGSYVTVATVNKLLNVMLQKQPDKLKAFLDTNDGMLQPAFIEKIKVLYSERWQLIKGTHLDYTREQAGENEPWKRCAQLLAGAEKIDKNYYLLLMPTITQPVDVISLEPITSVPLNHLILSSNGLELINVAQCVKNYELNGIFSYGRRALDAVELERIAYAHRKFHAYPMRWHRKECREGSSIHYSTVELLVDLVNGSVYPHGLLVGHDYNTHEMNAAEKAYQLFIEKYQQLPAAEKIALDKQIIYFGYRCKSFAEVLSDVLEKNECMAVLGQYTAQLVIDYAPFIEFRAEIEKRMDIQEMRQNSRRKVVADFLNLTDEVRLNRAQMMLSSLLSYPFKRGLTSVSGSRFKDISCFKESFSIPEELVPLCSRLIQMMDEKPLERRFSYSQLMLAEINNSPLRQPVSLSHRFYADRRNWLQAIENGTFFSRGDAWFCPKEVLRLIQLPIKKDRLPIRKDRRFFNFLDQLFNLYINSQQQEKDGAFYFNVYFKKLLYSLAADLRDDILLLLSRLPRVTEETVPLYQAWGQYLISRLVSFTSNKIHTSHSFFNKKAFVLIAPEAIRCQFNVSNYTSFDDFFTDMLRCNKEYWPKEAFDFVEHVMPAHLLKDKSRDAEVSLSYSP